MTESATRKMFVRSLRPYGVLQPIEIKFDKGIPDYAYALRCQNKTTDGWCELKWLPNWPKRASTSVCIAKLKLEQVMWQEKWHAAGGRVSTLLQVGRETYLLLAAPVVRLLYERRLTAVDLMVQARVCSTDGFPTIEVLRALTL